MGVDHRILKPQEGFQHNFLSTPADIALGGGAAGAGKSFALLLEFPRHTKHSKWRGAVFRRTYPQIMAPGGLWDTATELFRGMGNANGVRIPVSVNTSKSFFEWSSGSRLNFSHLQYEKDKYNWQGAQIGFLGFDELTQFTPTQFFYLLTRMRSATGIKPYCRATTNPQGTGWVKDFIEWYLYPDDYPDERLAGYPIPERAAKLRYFTMYKGKPVWGDSREGVLAELPASTAAIYDLQDVKSFTFVPGLLQDNAILQELDPSYRGNLLAQEEELMEQLLLGRWKQFRDEEGKLFPYKYLSDAFSNTFIGLGNQRYITADVALEGSDKFVIMVWDGWRIIAVYEYPKTTGPQGLAHINRAKTIHGVPNSHIIIDADGVGGYLPGFLRGAHSFHGGGRPMEIDGQEQKYDMLRSQCFYIASQKVKYYEAFFDVVSDTNINWNVDDMPKAMRMIIEELYPMEKVFTTKGLLSCTPKKIIRELIKRSPDYADCIMMRGYADIMPKRVASSSGSY